MPKLTILFSLGPDRLQICQWVTAEFFNCGIERWSKWDGWKHERLPSTVLTRVGDSLGEHTFFFLGKGIIGCIGRPCLVGPGGRSNSFWGALSAVAVGCADWFHESPFLCSSGLKFEERTQKMNVAKREKAMVNYFLYDGSTPPESSLRWRGVSWSERTLGCDFFGPTANLLICCS